ncbi:GatB/YqeY domain-containing protein [Desulfovibrio inopinatus]|uniref:GatB/YqeY domain-containing protein n=1 Tax=Desulfovibrio inopinatus TaxID=102109 RepID=UPI00042480ED|nr:GatB/YqeY domain-containing protein [Desulfovibrio inopinatus]
MNLLNQIEKDFITAYKAKDEVVVAVLRMVKTAAKNKHVELGRPLSDDETLDLLAKQAKQRQESIEQFSKAGRATLAEQEERELTVLQRYLPEPLSPEALQAAVEDAVAETGASSMKDMGRVISTVMAKYKGRVDGKDVSALVKARLSA